MQRPARRRGRPKSMIRDQKPSAIQALDRGLDVLEALAAGNGITLTGLADHLGQSPATMHRVLATLQLRQYVESDPERQEWFIGPQAFRLGSAFLRSTNIVERSRSVMRELVARTGETANLGIERDGHVLFVSQVETHEMIRAFFPHGTLTPLHASGIGKALLSAMDDERVEAFIRTAQLTRFTDKTVASAEQMREAIRQTRQRGYSFDDEERTIGMRCVAASIVNSHGEAIAGLSVSGPLVRMTDARVGQIGQWVVEAAGEISRRIGAA